MALDMLAQAYADEDSQIMTTTGLDNEDTVIEDSGISDDTVILNNDSYIDRLIKSNVRRQYSGSGTLTISPNAYIPPNSSHNYNSSHNIIYHPPYKHQPSHDFILIIENFQKQLHDRTKENEIIKNKLNQITTDYDDLKHEIKQLTEKENELKSYKSLNNKISEKNKQIKEYEPIIKWLQTQIKLNTNEKLCIETVKKWKTDYNVQEKQQYDDEKEIVNYDECVNYDENDEMPLLTGNMDQQQKRKRKFKTRNEKTQYKMEKSERCCISCLFE